MTSYYVPGVKGGGPIQSIKNIVDNLSDMFDFYIVTTDRDLGDDKPFKNIKTNKWSQVGKASVYYIDKKTLTWKTVKSLISSIDYDVIYLNSFFSYKYSIIPIVLKNIRKIPNKPIVLAPRGEFSDGAINLKRFKKLLYLRVSKALKLYDGISWHANTYLEESDIKKIFGDNINVTTAMNLTGNYHDVKYTKNIVKNSGELRIVYVSRIHPMKNLLQALEILKNFGDKIQFNIYGPIEDSYYWEKCKRIISQMPKNIIVKYNGLVPNNKLPYIYKHNHVFILLTLGENFGHAISEALIGGCPVIISDRTPWKNLDSFNVGWDLPLENNELIAEKIKFFIELENEKYIEMSKSAFEHSKSRSNQDEDLDKYLELLEGNN